MNRIGRGTLTLTMLLTAAALAPAALAQNAPSGDPAVNAIKGKIFDAQMAQKLFAGGLKFCKELDGTNFYFQPRDRVLNLEEYHRSLDNLARERVFNPVTRRPWTVEDATARWQQVQQEAATDKANCDLVAS